MKISLLNKTIIIVTILQVFVIYQVAYSDVISTENNYLKIEREEKELKSKLKEKYTAYEYKITNKYNEPIEINQIYFRKNANGQIAYLSVKTPSEDIKLSMKNKAKKNGLKTLGTSYLYYAVSLPFQQINNNLKNNKAEKESQKYENKYTNKFSIDSPKTIKVNTLALKKYKPILQLFFKNPITDEQMKLEL